MIFEIIGIATLLFIPTSRSALQIDLSEESTSATLEEFPYVVSLRSNGKHFCSGAILEKNWILTAAQCVYNLKPEEVTVVAGIIALKEGGQKRFVKQILIHENFKLPFENDIALLQLDNPLSYDETVNLIHLELNKSPPKTQVIALGWNHTLPEEEDELQKLYLSIIADDKCKNGVHKPQPNEKICADEYQNHGLCLNDIGGPLVDASLSAQIGIASESSCKFRYPQPYTHVSAFLNWIQAKTDNSAAVVEKIKNKLLDIDYMEPLDFDELDPKVIKKGTKNQLIGDEAFDYESRESHEIIQQLNGGKIDIGVLTNKDNFGNKGSKGHIGIKGGKGGIRDKGGIGNKGAIGDKGGVSGIGDKGEIGGIGDKKGISEIGNKGSIGNKGNKGSTGNKGGKGGIGNKGGVGGIGDKDWIGGKEGIGGKGGIGNKGGVGNKGSKGDIGNKGGKGGISDKGDKGGFGGIEDKGGIDDLGNKDEKGEKWGKGEIEDKGGVSTKEDKVGTGSIANNGGIGGIENVVSMVDNDGNRGIEIIASPGDNMGGKSETGYVNADKAEIIGIEKDKVDSIIGGEGLGSNIDKEHELIDSITKQGGSEDSGADANGGRRFINKENHIIGVGGSLGGNGGDIGEIKEKGHEIINSIKEQEGFGANGASENGTGSIIQKQKHKIDSIIGSGESSLAGHSGDIEEIKEKGQEIINSIKEQEGAAGNGTESIIEKQKHKIDSIIASGGNTLGGNGGNIEEIKEKGQEIINSIKEHEAFGGNGATGNDTGSIIEQQKHKIDSIIGIGGNSLLGKDEDVKEIKENGQELITSIKEGESEAGNGTGSIIKQIHKIDSIVGGGGEGNSLLGKDKDIEEIKEKGPEIINSIKEHEALGGNGTGILMEQIHKIDSIVGGGGNSLLGKDKDIEEIKEKGPEIINSIKEHEALGGNGTGSIMEQIHKIDSIVGGGGGSGGNSLLGKDKDIEEIKEKGPEIINSIKEHEALGGNGTGSIIEQIHKIDSIVGGGDEGSSILGKDKDIEEIKEKGPEIINSIKEHEAFGGNGSIIEQMHKIDSIVGGGSEGSSLLEKDGDIKEITETGQQIINSIKEQEAVGGNNETGYGPESIVDKQKPEIDYPKGGGSNSSGGNGDGIEKIKEKGQGILNSIREKEGFGGSSAGSIFDKQKHKIDSIIGGGGNSLGGNAGGIGKLKDKRQEIINSIKEHEMFGGSGARKNDTGSSIDKENHKRA